ncbi:hypothetical protein [Bradyrhizobium sp.]|uniref:AI-2E family transporter n=2 Tax=Bradyrhizobium sp. TaxID=376 RepID=UPI0025C66A6B|nr:hypothetical protein [Bradyrhizobium sp.]
MAQQARSSTKGDDWQRPRGAHTQACRLAVGQVDGPYAPGDGALGQRPDGSRLRMSGTAKASSKKVHPATSGTPADRPVEQKPLPLGSEARMNARVVLALVLVALGLWTAASFLPALIWATILAVTLWPLYLIFAKRFLGGPSGAAAFAFTVLVALILITPISLAVYEVAQQSDLLGDWLKRAREDGIDVPDWVARLPIAAEAWSNGGEPTSRIRRRPRLG